MDRRTVHTMMKLTRITGAARRARVRRIPHVQLLGRDELVTIGRLRYGASIGEVVLDADADADPWF
jgi:hypothetical protein